jgi:hypothetical protein
MSFRKRKNESGEPWVRISGRGPFPATALVDEMDADAVDFGPKLREPVDRFLLGSPIEPMLPVV